MQSAHRLAAASAQAVALSGSGVAEPELQCACICCAARARIGFADVTGLQEQQCLRFSGSLVGVDSGSAGCGVTGLSWLCPRRRCMPYVCLPCCSHVCLMYAVHPRPVPLPVIHFTVYSGPGIESRSDPVVGRAWDCPLFSSFQVLVRAAITSHASGYWDPSQT